MAPKEGKVQRTKLNLIQDGPQLVARVQKEARTWVYDVKKVMAMFNCNHGQAQTLIALAQIADAKGEQATASGRR